MINKVFLFLIVFFQFIFAFLPIARALPNIRYPLAGRGSVSSEFSLSRYHPILGSYRPHRGIDIAIASGTPILAAHSGVVKLAEYYGGYGLTVIIETDELQTLYAHQSKLLVKKGDTVEAGQVIGQVGSTGYSTGSHLHFEYRILRGGVWVAINPRPFLFPKQDTANQNTK